MMQLCPNFLRTKPCIPEMDFSGEVVSVGAGVPLTRGLEPGTLVFGSVSVSEHLGGQGALSEYLVVDAGLVALKPRGVSMAEAAGLPIAGCTALSLLEAATRVGGLAKGRKVLVNGATGGIGCFITQMVRDTLGPSGYIVASSSQDMAGLMKELGADEVCSFSNVIVMSQLRLEDKRRFPADFWDLQKRPSIANPSFPQCPSI